MTDAETEQAGRSYLWEICKALAPHHVALVRIRYTTGDGASQIDGLNENQQDKIMEWFGPQSNFVGGTVPPIFNVFQAVIFWKVPNTIRSSGGSTFGFG